MRAIKSRPWRTMPTTPPSITFVNTDTHQILGKLPFDGTNGTPKATRTGIEQTQWSAKTGLFYKYRRPIRAIRRPVVSPSSTPQHAGIDDHEVATAHLLV
jgi:hypothetical protein